MSDSTTNKTDVSVVFLKGIVGMIPVVGPLAAEVVGAIIPNQKIDRLGKFLQILDKKVEILDQNLLKIRFLTPGFIDLFEDSLYRAARALTEERLEYIAALLKNGLSDEKADYTNYKHILSLLSEINDIEVMLLRAYDLGWRGDFVEKNISVLKAEPATFGSPPEVMDKEILHKSYKDHLIRLKLLQPTFKHKRNESPEFDYGTGMLKASYTGISPLGRLLLRYVDLAHQQENGEHSESE
jgi:hypothetical protein